MGLYIFVHNHQNLISNMCKVYKALEREEEGNDMSDFLKRIEFLLSINYRPNEAVLVEKCWWLELGQLQSKAKRADLIISSTVQDVLS